MKMHIVHEDAEGEAAQELMKGLGKLLGVDLKDAEKEMKKHQEEHAKKVESAQKAFQKAGYSERDISLLATTTALMRSYNKGSFLRAALTLADDFEIPEAANLIVSLAHVLEYAARVIKKGEQVTGNEIIEDLDEEKMKANTEFALSLRKKIEAKYAKELGQS